MANIEKENIVYQKGSLFLYVHEEGTQIYDLFLNKNITLTVTSYADNRNSIMRIEKNEFKIYKKAYVDVESSTLKHVQYFKSKI